MSKHLQLQLKRKGIFSLSDKDLICLLLRSNKEESANKILDRVSWNLPSLAKMSVTEITLCGVSESEATYIVAAMELGRRRNYQSEVEKDQVTGSRNVANLMRPIIGDLKHEEFWVLYLNRKNRVITSLKLSQGGITGTVIDVRLILKQALEQNATNMIVCHNHPSGESEPSDSDKRITRQLKDAGAIMDISLLDHVIITGTNHFSFADEGLL